MDRETHQEKANPLEDNLIIPAHAQTPKYIEHSSRYTVYLIYNLINIFMGTFVSAFTPISEVLVKTYHVSNSTVLRTSSLYLIGNIAAAAFVFPLSKWLGLRRLMIMVAVLVALGTFVRTLLDTAFEFVLVGQFISGFAACFVVNILMQFCYNWFHPSNRGLFVSVAGVLNVFGGGLGNMIPLLFVSAEANNPDITKTEMAKYVWIIFGVAVVNLVLVILFFAEKPPQEYGWVGQDEHRKEETGNFLALSKRYLSESLSEGPYRNISLVYIISNSVVVLVGTVINTVFVKFNLLSVA
jgi:MFS family permease